MFLGKLKMKMVKEILAYSLQIECTQNYQNKVLQ